MSSYGYNINLGQDLSLFNRETFLLTQTDSANASFDIFNDWFFGTPIASVPPVTPVTSGMYMMCILGIGFFTRTSAPGGKK